MDTIGVILLLLVAGVWAFFLLPALVSGRRDAPVSTTQEFTRLTERLESVRRANTDSGEHQRRRVQARRRRVLILLVMAAAASIGVALWLNSIVLLGLHLAIDAMLAWYVVMLMQIKQRRRKPSKVVDIRSHKEKEEDDEIQIVVSS